jgi:hypothetical protein
LDLQIRVLEGRIRKAKAKFEARDQVCFVERPIIDEDTFREIALWVELEKPFWL